MHYRTTPLVGEQDSPALWRDFEELLREYAGRDLAQPHLSSIWRDLENLRARYAAPSGRAILLHVDAELAGCVALAGTTVPGACEVKRLYVRHTYRGKSWGSVLLREALGRAGEAGYRQALLSTWPDNPKALALYASMGFVPVPPFKNSPDQKLVYLGCDLGSAGRVIS
jgi:ribosomal protein S18 acetylase RimI-like enzyme